MKYILIIFLVGGNNLGGRAIDHIEFQEQRSCEVAAEILRETETGHGKVFTACVPKPFGYTRDRNE